MVSTSFRVSPAPDCRRCVRALHLELGRLESVEHVDAHRHDPWVVVTSRTVLPGAAVEAAIAEAGYEMPRESTIDWLRTCERPSQ